MGATWIVAMIVGIASEALAERQRFWVYHRPAYRVINVIVMFGLVMGTLAAFVPVVGFVPIFVVAFLIGLGYEAANLAWLGWWRFPDDRLLWLEGQRACALGVALAWGTVPVLVAVLRRLA